MKTMYETKRFYVFSKCNKNGFEMYYIGIKGYNHTTGMYGSLKLAIEDANYFERVIDDVTVFIN